MTIFTKPFRKNLRSSINSGQKGRLVLQKSKRRSRMVRVANLASKKSSIEVSLSPLSSQSSVPSSNTVVLDEGTELCNDNGLRVTSIELFLEARLVARTILERRLLS